MNKIKASCDHLNHQKAQFKFRGKNKQKIRGWGNDEQENWVQGITNKCDRF